MIEESLSKFKDFKSVSVKELPKKMFLDALNFT